MCVSWGVGVVPYERVLEPLYSSVVPHRIGGEDGSPPMLTLNAVTSYMHPPQSSPTKAAHSLFPSLLSPS